MLTLVERPCLWAPESLTALSTPPPPQTDPIEFVENVCENMQLFPKEDFLTGDQLMFHFDPQVGALSFLRLC